MESVRSKKHFTVELLSCRVESKYRDVLFREPKDGIYSTNKDGVNAIGPINWPLRNIALLRDLGDFAVKIPLM